jgi:hypothetical protein
VWIVFGWCANGGEIRGPKYRQGRLATWQPVCVYERACRGKAWWQMTQYPLFHDILGARRRPLRVLEVLAVVLRG